MRQRRFAAVILLVFSVVVTGCIVVPLPSENPQQVLVGKALDSADLNAVLPTLTTRNEVIAQLGVPPMDLMGMRMLVYPWVSLKRNWLTIFATPQGIGAMTLPQTDNTALFVAVDDGGKVVKLGFAEQLKSDGFSIVNRARRWAAENKVSVPARSRGYTPVDIPRQSGLITLHRATPPNSSLGFFTRARFPESVAISIDGQFVAELLDEEYVSIPLSIGVHVVGAHPAPPYRYWPEHPGARSISAIHPSSIPVTVTSGNRLFIQLEATMGAGLTMDTVMKLQTQDEARTDMSHSRSIW
jgi:hypothetical protein